MSLSALIRNAALRFTSVRRKSDVKIFRYIGVLVMVLCLSARVEAQELDSLRQAALTERLNEYFKAIEREGTEVQKQECDFLINSTEDSLVRQFIALQAYEHYMNSPVMGSEAVAIYLLDNWFLPGKVKMKTDIDLINARVFADFNRQSLVGMKAPELTMKTMDDNHVSFFAEDDASSRFRIIYFYDTDCSKCKLESILLRNILEDGDFPVELLAIYSGDNKKAWEEYAVGRLNIDSDVVTVQHLWDPEFDSDFQRKYGVLQTPKIFLVRPDGVILGRGLDVEALYTMLRSIFAETKLSYGSEESVQLFDGIFSAEEASVQKVCDLVDYISSSTLSKGDTLMFRQLSGDLLYYLATHSGEGIKEGLKYLIDENITARPKVWDTEDDSLKVVGFAQIMDDLLSKARPGTLVPDIKVPAERISGGKIKNATVKLRKIGAAKNIIVFYTEGCEICKAEKAAIKELVAADHKTRAIFVNVDRILAENPSSAEILFDSFDLSSLPYIILTDKKGVISRRYLSYR